MIRYLLRPAAVGAMVLALASCATGRLASRGDDAARRGDWDAAVAYFREALQANPKLVEVRVALERAMREAATYHMERAKKLEAEEQLSGAAAEYRLAVEYDPANSLALTRALAIERRIREETEAARPPTRMEEMQRQAAQASPIPRLDPRTQVPRLSFTNAAIRDILNAIGMATGINVTYAPGTEGVVARPYSIQVEQQSLEQVLNQVLSVNSLTFKVLDSRSIFIYQDNAGERAKYDDLYQVTFYLSHAEAQEVTQILNQMNATTTAGASRPVVTQNKSLNAINVRATAPMMGLIENIIKTADKPRAEVLIDVTILEVSRTRLKDFGIDLSQYAIGLAFSPETIPTTTTQLGFITPPPPINMSSLQAFSRDSVYATIPTAVIRFLESDQRTRLLAKPQLRGREGAQLTLNLGDEIPVPQTSFLATATGGVPTQPQISYNYRPIGVNLSLTPRVTYQDEIILDPFVVDKSGLGPNVDVAGQSLPTFVKRTASVAMRLRDGESNLLAGLIREEDREIARSLPGINRIPILRSLFGNTSGSNDSSDIIMIVTPHIVRSREITAEDLKPLYVGTSTNLGAGTTPTLISPTAPPPPPVTGGNPAQQGQGAGQVAGAPPVGGAATPPAATTRAPGVVPVEPVGGAPKPGGGVQVMVAVPEGAMQMGGAPYNVPVSIDGVSQLGSVTLTITYDPKVVRATTVNPGTFMQQGGVQPTFAPKIDEAMGRIDIAIARPATSPGANGSGMLAGLVLQAVGAGTSRINITAVAMTVSGQPIPVQAAPANVTVK